MINTQVFTLSLLAPKLISHFLLFLQNLHRTA